MVTLVGAVAVAVVGAAVGAVAAAPPADATRSAAAPAAAPAAAAAVGAAAASLWSAATTTPAAATHVAVVWEGLLSVARLLLGGVLLADASIVRRPKLLSHPVHLNIKLIL